MARLRDKGRIKPGQKVLVIGASGGVGTFAVQIAKFRWIGPRIKVLQGAFISRSTSQTVAFFIAKRRTDDLLLLKELMEPGKGTPVIDRAYPLIETAAAMRYLEAGHARGKVVITVSPSV